MNPIYDLLRSDGSIVINKKLIFAIGLNEATIFSELISRYNYFADRNQLTSDGFFFNTISDLYSGTGLGTKPQRTAINNLKKLGLIECSLRGIPPKRYFRITDNFSVLEQLLNTGKEKQAQSLRESQFVPKGQIKKTQRDKLNCAFGTTNNTKGNNTKQIIQTYIGLPADGHSFFGIYENCFRAKFGKPHKRIKATDLDDLIEWVFALESYGVDERLWFDTVEEHFASLPPKNDGGILAFMAASYRYFETPSPLQEAEF